ncbi:MAG: gamma-glutamyltransferase [Proteobacteria bacterium]|nr:gamma-glutamyltransferase [Pseudomonadota bacterium]
MILYLGRRGIFVLALLLGACAGIAPPPRPLPPPQAQPQPQPQPQPVDRVPQPAAAATAHPLATQAALQMLAAGGHAIDGLIAAQMVLGLVEPQSSGIGGGTLLLLWDEAGQRLHSHDGLAAAPARATASLRTDVDGRLLPADEVARGGRSVGVPGTLAVLEQVHRRHGRLPWARLFEPAIRLATEGFPVAPYVHGILARDPGARQHPEFRADWYDEQGRAWPAGTVLHNPAYAHTLRQVATSGAAGFWRDGGAARLVAAAARGAHPTLMQADDVLNYRAVEREPLCAPVRVWKVCVAGPPSFGGIAVLQMLKMLDLRSGNTIDAAALDGAAFWHLYAEAGRLAQADRRQWVGDPDQVAVPAAGLVADDYLRGRAALIDPARALPTVGPGAPAAGRLGQAADLESEVAAQTSQIVVADAAGNVASATTTINLNFGSRLRVDGYVLNNALTNFGPAPLRGQVIANQMAPGRRPITSMAPVIVFDARGRVLVAGGSAGGGPIVDYITRNLVELLWLGRSPAQALAGGHVSTASAPVVQLEAGSARAALAAPLRALGHEVAVEPLPSGAGFLRRVEGGGWLGAADPRRDGVALGQ